ncbi:MAG: cell filamentation protein Fic [Lachnospiraceae bacterium]|nr:cell filamentation protein Fic [Lachnospiraceae bacterium]
MLSAVLKSSVAIQVSIRIMDTFVEMRKYMANTSLIYDRVNAIEVRQITYQEQTDRKLEQIFDYIADHKENNQKVFFDSQIFDAFALMTDLIQQSSKTIVLIDGYVDIVTLNILAKKKDGVDVMVYTLPSAKLTAQDIANFNAQYPNLTVKYTTAFHDRFMIIDGTTAYHIGASIKDAGKKCFGINKIEDIGVINDLLQRAVLTS